MQEFTGSNNLPEIKIMGVSLIRCLKGWGAGVFILGFPVIFFNDDFYWGDEIWKTFVFVFFVFFPALLLFEFVFTRLLLFSKLKQFVVLVFVLIMSEIVFFRLPLTLTQVKFSGDFISFMPLFLSIIIAAIIVLQILFPKKSLIIVQREI